MTRVIAALVALFMLGGILAQAAAANSSAGKGKNSSVASVVRTSPKGKR